MKRQKRSRRFYSDLNQKNVAAPEIAKRSRLTASIVLTLSGYVVLAIAFAAAVWVRDPQVRAVKNIAAENVHVLYVPQQDENPTGVAQLFGVGESVLLVEPLGTI